MRYNVNGVRQIDEIEIQKLILIEHFNLNLILLFYFSNFIKTQLKRFTFETICIIVMYILF